MAKIRLVAIAMLAIPLLGFVLYASTNIMTFEGSFYLDANNNFDIFQNIKPFGNGKIIEDGVILGIPFDETTPFTAEDLSNFPVGVWLLVLLGVILALGSGVLYLIDHKKIPKIVSMLVGLLGGVMMLIGPFLILGWEDFSEPAIKLGFAFFIGIIFAILTMGTSVFLFFWPPKKTEG